MKRAEKLRVKTIELAEPSLELKESFLSALKRYKEEGLPLDQGIDDRGEDFDTFLKKIKDESKGVNMKPGRVLKVFTG